MKNLIIPYDPKEHNTRVLLNDPYAILLEELLEYIAYVEDINKKYIKLDSIKYDSISFYVSTLSFKNIEKNKTYTIFIGTYTINILNKINDFNERVNMKYDPIDPNDPTNQERN